MDLADLVPAGRLSFPRRLLRQPLLHFLLLGALLQALQPAASRWLADHAPRAPIVLRAEDVDGLRREWQREAGRPPREAELRASLRHLVDQEILLREAQRLGLDVRDGVVRERLLNNLHFAFGDDDVDETQLLQQARALQMEQHDPVVRRRLMQLMEQRYKTGIALSEREIRAYVEAHPERYAQPARFDFEQRFFSGDRRGAAAEADAQRALAADGTGDPFLLGTHFEQRTLAEVTRQFGDGFARALQSAPPDRWIGPVASAYGWHLLWLQRVDAPQPAAWTEVREQAQYALLAEREDQVLQQTLKQLRAEYPLRLPAGVQL